MGRSNKIKPLSKKLAVLLIKNEAPSDLEKPEIFNIKRKALMLFDISEVNAQIIFGFDTNTAVQNSVANGTEVTETISGITLTVSDAVNPFDGIN